MKAPTQFFRSPERDYRDKIRAQGDNPSHWAPDDSDLKIPREPASLVDQIILGSFAATPALGVPSLYGQGVEAYDRAENPADPKKSWLLFGGMLANAGGTTALATGHPLAAGVCLATSAASSILFER